MAAGPHPAFRPRIKSKRDNPSPTISCCEFASPFLFPRRLAAKIAVAAEKASCKTIARVPPVMNLSMARRDRRGGVLARGAVRPMDAVKCYVFRHESADSVFAAAQSKSEFGRL